ncbi:MAG: hypothetical protein AAFY09_15600, partial [Pseudomonadota bacterium]
ARVDGRDEKYLLSSYKGPGSTKPSEIAARKKLLQHAGLSDNDIAIALDTASEPSPVVVAQAAPPFVQPPVTEPGLSLNSPNRQAPTIVANKQPSNGIVAASSSTVNTSIGQAAASTNAPIELRPRLLWKPETTPVNVIKNDVDRQAYLGEHRVTSAFDALTLNNHAEVNAFESRTIFVGRYSDRGDIQRVIDEMGRYGDVSLVPIGDKKRKTEIYTESRLPFARKIARRLADELLVGHE